jgi:hypothetical protein
MHVRFICVVSSCMKCQLSKLQPPNKLIWQIVEVRTTRSVHQSSNPGFINLSSDMKFCMFGNHLLEQGSRGLLKTAQNRSKQQSYILVICTSHYSIKVYIVWSWKRPADSTTTQNCRMGSSLGQFGLLLWHADPFALAWSMMTCAVVSSPCVRVFTMSL